MTKEQVKALLVESGIDATTADTIIANEKAAQRFAGLKHQNEYDELATRAAAMEAAANKSKQYETWYATNYAAIQKLQQDVGRYNERYGNLDDPNPNHVGQTTNQQAGAISLTKEEVAQIARESIGAQYGPQWSKLLKETGAVIQKHILRGRKNEVDIEELAKLAQEKHGGNMTAAYEEWDRPEADKIAKEDQEKEIDRRVKEKLAAARTSSGFPAGADASPSYAPSGLSKDRGDGKYDRSKLLETAATGVYERPN